MSEGKRSSSTGKLVSLLVLLGTVLVVGLIFFRVVQPFLFPLFFAGVLAILFRPLYVRMVAVCRGWSRVAAAVTTLLIVLLFMLPVAGGLALAGRELVELGGQLVGMIKLDRPIDQWLDPQKNPRLAELMELVQEHVTEEDLKEFRHALLQSLKGLTSQVYERSRALVSNVLSLIMGFLIMLLALYYFFADGPQILATLQRLSPLDDEYERQLFRQFERVCRAVVLATLLSALVQGGLAGIGFAILGVSRVWLLTVLTVFFAMIPFLGTAFVWGAVAIGLLFQGRYGAATFLIIYGAGPISLVDNVIKPYVIHGRASLHPLLVLVSVLGALQMIGLWGIFVGPIVAAFFYALLNILHGELHRGPSRRGPAAAPIEMPESEPSPATVGTGAQPPASPSGQDSPICPANGSGPANGQAARPDAHPSGTGPQARPDQDRPADGRQTPQK